VSRDDFAADLSAAYESLFHKDPLALARTQGSPWPDAEPYVKVWCPSPKKGCLIGAVYLTEWGFFWVHVSWHRDTATHGQLSRGYNLLTFPDGSRRSFGHISPGTPAGCYHWKPKHQRPAFNADEMFALLDDVQGGRIRRPANYVAPWRR
jgi:hypothetical protein